VLENVRAVDQNSTWEWKKETNFIGKTRPVLSLCCVFDISNMGATAVVGALCRLLSKWPLYPINVPSCRKTRQFRRRQRHPCPQRPAAASSAAAAAAPVRLPPRAPWRRAPVARVGNNPGLKKKQPSGFFGFHGLFQFQQYF
jgi:hypothetical protein